MPPRQRRAKSSNYAFRDTVKASCGHDCDKWPEHKKGHVISVICDTCDDWVPLNPKAAKPRQLTIEDALAEPES